MTMRGCRSKFPKIEIQQPMADRRPCRVLNAKTGHWLAKTLLPGAKPEWTKKRDEAWLGLAVAALRQVGLLRELGVDAELDPTAQ